VVLDLQLPGLDGLSLCAELRRDRQTRAIPVIILTARGDEADRVVGLEVGADDYVEANQPAGGGAVRALMRRLERRGRSRPFVLGRPETTPRATPSGGRQLRT
jgi:DNA-binding response OmpR family regulator